MQAVRVACWAVQIVMLAAAGCGGAPTQAQKESQTAKAEADGVQRVRVVAGSYFFKPNHIVVKANAPLELLASKEAGLAPHDLVIQSPDGSTLVQEELSTEPKKIAFTARKPGKYPIYCSKKPPFMASHRERGMEGVLEVVP